MNRKLSLIMLLASAFMLIFIISCSKSKDDDTGGNNNNGGGTTIPPGGTCSGTPGPLFKEVTALVSSRCVSCHNATTSNGGMNFSNSCNIVDNKTRIKVRAVDEGTMPQTG